MRTRTLLTLLLAFVAVSLALWDFAPRTSSQGKPHDIRTREKESPDSAEKGTSAAVAVWPGRPGEHDGLEIPGSGSDSSGADQPNQGSSQRPHHCDRGASDRSRHRLCWYCARRLV